MSTILVDIGGELLQKGDPVELVARCAQKRRAQKRHRVMSGRVTHVHQNGRINVEYGDGHVSKDSKPEHFRKTMLV
jgi:prepilin-type processing-associated H-X9-DG protein